MTEVEQAALMEELAFEDPDDLAEMVVVYQVEIDRLREALQECMEEIDIYIDADYPIGAHPLYAKKNKWAKEANPARVALRSGV